MKEIGGFFGLELSRGREFHEGACALNSARNCLRVIVRSRSIDRLLVPVYACEALREALKLEKVEVSPYRIEADFSPVLGSHNDDYLLYINYFGVNSTNIENLLKTHHKVIVDNAQAFFSRPVDKIDTIYSPRKFFGVPDGGYVYGADISLEDNIETAVSYNRCDHLLKRVDVSASDGYPDFKKAEELIDRDPIRKMSTLTRALLGSINYEEARSRRLNNFASLHNALHNYNELSLNPGAYDVPLVYPFLTKNPILRQTLIQNSIYIAKYWPDPEKRIPSDSWEAYLASNLIPLPIDQRYGKEDMDVVIALVMDNITK